MFRFERILKLKQLKSYKLNFYFYFSNKIEIENKNWNWVPPRQTIQEVIHQNILEVIEG